MLPPIWRYLYFLPSRWRRWEYSEQCVGPVPWGVPAGLVVRGRVHSYLQHRAAGHEDEVRWFNPSSSNFRQQPPQVERHHTLFGILHPIVPHFIPYCLHLPPFFPYKKTDIILYLALFIQLYLILSHIASIYPHSFFIKKTDIILYLALFIQLYLILSHISSIHPHSFLIKKHIILKFIWHCSSNCTSFYPILPPFTPILSL